MRTCIFLSIIVLLSASCESRDSPIFLDSPLPEATSEYQKKIIGHLSGKYELANGTRVRSRWSKEERELTRVYLKELLQQLNIEPQEHHYTWPNLNPAIDLILDPFKGTNIYGVLPATQASNEFIVLGAHYDTGKRNAPGAIDNATGVALISSVVKELADSKDRNKNIMIVFFDQEEEELIGSSAFVTHLQKKQWNIHSVHCFDMVGWDEDKDGAIEIFSPSESLRTIYKETAQAHNIPVKEIIIDPVGYEVSSTDFDAFVPKGYNVIGAGETFYHGDSTPFKDSPEDTFETVDFDYLLTNTNLVTHIIKQLVN